MSNIENRNEAPAEEIQDGWRREVTSNPVGGIVGAAIGTGVGVLSGVAAGPVGSLAGAVVGGVIGGLVGSHAFTGAGAPSGAASADPPTSSITPEAASGGTEVDTQARQLDEAQRDRNVLP